MSSAPFTVMDASAGSGKTRNLVKAVLLESLSESVPDNALRPIMAITFTNKAAAEMKGRLLEYLEDFSKPEPSQTGLLSELEVELGISESEVKSRSKALLKYILHNYNDLSFGTIDSFTSRLVRTFSKDLALSENFEIVLDLDKLLQEVTDHVISLAGRDEDLTKMLTNFVEQKLDDEKSWNIDGALKSMAKKLMEEKHREPLMSMQNFSAEQLLDIRKNLEAKRKIILQMLKSKAEEIAELITSNGIDFDSFSYKKAGLYSYLQKGITGDLLGATNITRRKLYIENNSWYSAKTAQEQKEKIDAISDKLRELVLALEGYAQKEASFFLLAGKISNNMFAIATLNALQQALVSIEESQNLLPLAEFNHIINTQIKDEPAPYIFERLGERYKHFFVDEFQDTSKLQWQNIFPLIENAVASSGTSLIVGDAKQSIYRWRNGEAEQFISLSQKAKAGKITHAIAGKPHPLADNWRSKKQIVDFNNVLFTSAAALLNNQGYVDLYEKANQNPKKEDGGFVEVQLLERKDYDESALGYILKTIDELRNEGAAFKDIAILVRSNKHGASLVQELTTRGYPVISGDSLLLGKSYEGNLLAALGILRSSPNNLQQRWALVDSLVKLEIVQPKNGFYTFADSIVNSNWETTLQNLDDVLSGFAATYSSATDLYTYCRQMAKITGLDNDNNAFVDTFLQSVYQYIDREGGSAYEFADWWDEEGCNKAISAPEEMDAVRVATIHKSKGLQYPIVIIPFVKWSFREKKREAWIELDPKQFFGLDQMLVPINGSDAEQIGGDYKLKYEELTEQEKFDNLNMLYVACTRAERRLYLGVQQFIPTQKGDGQGQINIVIDSFLQTQPNNKIEDNLYQWGRKERFYASVLSDSFTRTTNVKSSGWQNKVKMAFNAPEGWETNQHDARAWGNRVHYALSRIRSSADAVHTLNRLRHSGTFSQGETKEISDIINHVISHPKLEKAFAPDVKVFNERDIILPDESRKRPDRIIQLSTGELIIIDYKTGERKNTHNRQLIEYAALLQQAGFTVAEKNLVYLNDNIQVESI